MADDLDGELDAEEYEALIDGLAEEAASALPERSRSDAAWDAVGAVVPQLSADVCDRVLALADSEPREAVVDQVTDERGSDDAERRRARALTAIVGDVEARLESRANR